MQSSSATVDQQALVLEIDRTFDAPRDLVWRLWRDPEHMVRWYGPEGCWLSACESDFVIGGKWRRAMSNPSGHDHWIHGEYLEIEEPSRLSFTYINDRDAFETIVTMDFLDAPGGRTRMLFRQAPFISREERDGHEWGWNSTLDLLGRYLLLFADDNWSPMGRPRHSGVDEDFAAARARADNEEKSDERRTAEHR